MNPAPTTAAFSWFITVLRSNGFSLSMVQYAGSTSARLVTGVAAATLGLITAERDGYYLWAHHGGA
jgi:hypothetical protein